MEILTLELAAVLPFLEERARVLRKRQNVKRVLLFGSLVRGNYAPGSDADIFIELDNDHRRWHERIPDFLAAFSGCPVPVEVFPFTEAEVQEAIRNQDMFITTILRDCREIGTGESPTQ